MILSTVNEKVILTPDQDISPIIEEHAQRGYSLVSQRTVSTRGKNHIGAKVTTVVIEFEKVNVTAEEGEDIEYRTVTVPDAEYGQFIQNETNNGWQVSCIYSVLGPSNYSNVIFKRNVQK